MKSSTSFSAQNNLPITGSREQLIERLCSIQVDIDSPHRTPSSDASEPPSKQACTSQSSQSASTSASEPVVVSADSPTINNMAEPSNSNNITVNEAWQHGGRKGGVPPNANPNFNPAAPKTLISHIPDQKLKSVSGPSQGVSALPPSQSPSPSMAHQPLLRCKFTFATAWNELFTSSATFLPHCLHSQTSLSHAVSLWNLILCCQRTHASIKVISRLNCLQEFRGQTSQCSYTLLQEKPTLTPSTGGCLTAFVLKLHSPFDLFPP